MLNKILKFTAGILLAANLYGCTAPEIKSGYNALETAAINDGNVRNRLLVNEDLKAGNSRVGYHGLNDIDNCNLATYYGRHVLTAGNNSAQGIAVLKTGDSWLVDAKYGVRLSDFSMLGGYGFVDLSAERDSANLSVFFGRQTGRASVEVYESAEFPFDNKPVFYTELQFNRNIGKRASIFTRMETAEFDAKATKYLFGWSVTF